MKKEDLEQMSTEALLKKQRNLTFGMSVLVGACLVMLFASSLTWSENNVRNITTIASGVAMVPLFVVFASQLKAVREELDTR
jgi:hypothetical protein